MGRFLPGLLSALIYAYGNSGSSYLRTQILYSGAKEANLQICSESLVANLLFS